MKKLIESGCLYNMRYVHEHNQILEKRVFIYCDSFIIKIKIFISDVRHGMQIERILQNFFLRL